MRNQIYIIGCILGMVTLNIACDLSYDFRDSRWGDNKYEIQKNETADISMRMPAGLVYEGDAFGLPCQITYAFENDSLIRGQYIFSPSHESNYQFVEDYEFLRNDCIQKYGPPLRSDTTWKDSTLKSMPLLWGEAVSLGQLQIKTIWHANRSMIELVMAGGGGYVILGLEYTDIKFKMR